MVEPLRMLFDIGMVRGALDGDIEGDVDVVSFRGGNEMVEIFESTELGMN